MEAFEYRVDLDRGDHDMTFVSSPLEPCEGLIPVAETQISRSHANLHHRRVRLLNVVENLARFAVAARQGHPVGSHFDCTVRISGTSHEFRRWFRSDRLCYLPTEQGG